MKPGQSFLSDEQILSLSLADPVLAGEKATVQVKNGWITENKQILMLDAPGNEGMKVVHWQAFKGWNTEDKKILRTTTNDGRSVAYFQAGNKWTTEDRQLLMLKTNYGHYLAFSQHLYSGWTTDDPEVLTLCSNHTPYPTLAHKQAENGWVTENPSVLKLRDQNGESVEDTIEFRRMEKFGISVGQARFIANEYGITGKMLKEFAEFSGEESFAKHVSSNFKPVFLNYEVISSKGREEVAVWQRCRNADMAAYLSASVSVPTTGNKMRESSIRIK